MEAELKFEREKRNGVAVVGSYLIDAARRLGVEIYDDCGRLGLCDSCAVTIKSGKEFLSETTKAEIEQLSDERRQRGERLSCQAKVINEGEIIIVTHEKMDKRPDAERKHEEFRKEFEALPLGQKISQLLDLEAVTLSETFSVVLNSPYTIGGKVVDFMSQFGFKFTKEAKEAQRPEEHKPTAETDGKKAKKTQPKRTKKAAEAEDNS